MEHFMNEKARTAQRVAYNALFARELVVGFVVAVVALAVSAVIFTNGLTKNYVPVEATVTSVQYDAENKTQLVYVDYTVGEQTYSSSFDESSENTVNKGDVLTVYYNSSEVTDIVETPSIGSTLLFGSIFALTGILVITIDATKCKRWKDLKRFEKKARAASTQKTDLDENKADLSEYLFKTDSFDKMSRIMQDSSKKFEIVADGQAESFHLLNADGNAIMEATANKCISLIPTKYQIKKIDTGSLAEHSIRNAFITPGKINANFNKIGRLDIGLDTIFTSNYIVDGKLFGYEFFGNGYYLDITNDGLRKTYSVKKNGEEIAVISDMPLEETSNVNVKILKNMPSIGQYKVLCKENELDMAFMLCVLIRSESTSRV